MLGLVKVSTHTSELPPVSAGKASVSSLPIKNTASGVRTRGAGRVYADLCAYFCTQASMISVAEHVLSER